MQHILLAEDDHRLASLVRDYLSDNGFRVTLEGRGDRVPEQVRQLRPDLLILDIMLPGKDGLTLCRELRQGFHGPIMMLTARNEDADQILGLEFGADDYVIKPAEPRILLARIRALLRRVESGGASASQTLSFGGLDIHGGSRSVQFNGQPVKLSSHEFDLLWLLAQRAGEVIGRDFLFRELYGRPYDGMDRTIDVRVSQLRKKLGDNPDNPERIKTIWGRGYLFIAEAWGDA
ncbi:winged helix-turn-helix domain-containing protein [Marinimicrobium sp. ARAG 43.8]|uniref:winged helix-turn-helix domain-containing protein n=1 Tax=Marinimicrobium sp. ARAG 43.8 TaxID=3418719 RepID=UPI003CF86186